MNCKDRILYATDSYDVRDNVVNNRTFSTRGDEYFVLANCVLTEGYYVQYHINATNTCGAWSVRFMLCSPSSVLFSHVPAFRAPVRCFFHLGLLL